MWKFFTGTPWGTKAPPGKGGHHPEASLGESSEMAASSVGSGHKSRVIEPRNTRSLELSPLCRREQHPSAQQASREGLSRGLRAGQMCGWVPWELGRAARAKRA